jgi:hypothetical protein
MIGFMEAVRSRLFGPRKEEPSVTIAALEQEFAGTVSTKLDTYSYRPATKEVEGRPSFRMSRETVEICRVPEVSKIVGEELKAHFVFTPTRGERQIFTLTNAQAREEVEAGYTLRFKFPLDAYKKMFNETGTGLIYVSGAGEHRWVFTVVVSCSVPNTLHSATSSRDA